jgi:hypothetical protein
MSIKERVSYHKTTFEPALLDSTSAEPNHNEDYEEPSEEGAGTWVDLSPDPEKPPAKRSRKADKATAVSPHFEQSCLFPDDIPKQTPLEDLVGIRDILLLELCRHEGLRELVTRLSGFPLCGNCGESDGTLRCTECMIDAMFCSSCMCTKHREQPLHRIEVCGHFLCQSKIDLKALLAMDRHLFCCPFPG